MEFLLTECQSNPNVTDEDGTTLVDLSRNPDIIRLLLQHGAKADKVYKKHSKLIGKISSERPPDLPLYTLIVGDGGVGKSTLLKSLLTSKVFLAKFKREAKPVEGVDQKTVGIIPYEVYTKEFGKIIFFDFAGQKEFYTSHCAILENAVQTSPPIVFLCANLVKSEQAITDSAIRWLTLVQNQCSNLKDKAHVIVIGSHADVVKQNGEDPWAKGGMFADIIKQFPQFEFLEFIAMDCRFPDSDDMKRAKKLIQKSSAILRSPEVISLNAHTFYIYLAESFQGHLTVSLGAVSEKVRSDLNNVQKKRMKDILLFIPTTLTRLLEICDQLHKSGLLLFLRNDSCEEKSFLVIDQTTLLSKVTGTVFAPENFRQHCKLASSTGVVPLSNFIKAFSSYNIDMLISFMGHLELCFEISDKKVLEYISKELDSFADTENSVSEKDLRFLFFPGLIRIKTPDEIREVPVDAKFVFGCIFETSQDNEFFDPRCFQVLILRVVFTFRLAPASRIQHNVPSLQRFCSVWKRGICWCNDDGVTSHIELAENGRSIVLKMHSKMLEIESLELRTKIVSTICETINSFGRNVKVIESVINPSQVVENFLKSSSDLTLVSIKDLAAAVSSGKQVVKSTCQVAFSLEHLLQFEPYAYLDQNTLQCIHSEKNKAKDKKVSEGFISHFASQIAKQESDDLNCVAKSNCLYSGILNPAGTSKLKGSLRQELIHSFAIWRSETEGTYNYMRQTLNKYSVFSGRNPLVSVVLFYFITSLILSIIYHSFYADYLK